MKTSPTMARPLRILTWHVHGNYLYNLTQVPHHFLLVTDAARSVHHTGRSGALPWGNNVFEVDVQAVRETAFDLVLYQSREAWEDEGPRILSAAQQRLPRIYLEHDPPQQHPTNTPHWANDGQTLLVHVTPFNALMWDNGRSPVQVIEHGVQLLRPARWHGGQARGLVVINNLDRRGRRLGLDVFRQVAQAVPLRLVGMGSERVGGDGEVSQHTLAPVMAEHRFFFNPIRYTSLGLAVIEAMLVGLPVVGLATTELVTVIRNGDNGYIDTRIEPLVAAMHRLLQDRPHAQALGEAGRRTAQARFGIGRFVRDWERALRLLTG